MNDPVLARVLAALDGADGHGLSQLEADLATLRGRSARLAATGLRVQESPYLAFARRLTGLPQRPPALAASA
jgi:hypothetical protein